METDVQIEDHVKCKYTGVKGVVLTKTEFVNGCIQFGVAQKFDPKASPEQSMAEFNVDSQSLIITKKGPRHKKEPEPDEDDDDEQAFTGGPSRMKMRSGY